MNTLIKKVGQAVFIILFILMGILQFIYSDNNTGLKKHTTITEHKVP